MILKQIINWVSSNTKLIVIGIIIVMISTIGLMYKQLKSKDAEIAKVTNNKDYYESLVSATTEKNRVLQLSINDFQNSNDSVIQAMQKVKDELKIKDKELKSAISMRTEIHATDSTKINTNTVNFDSIPTHLNNLTTIITSRKDSILYTTLDLVNVQTLFVINSKEYRHRYKNWFSRLLHFDWKKDTVYKYEIDNSNKLIKVLDTRVIEIQAD